MSHSARGLDPKGAKRRHGPCYSIYRMGSRSMRWSGLAFEQPDEFYSPVRPCAPELPITALGVVIMPTAFMLVALCDLFQHGRRPGPF